MRLLDLFCGAGGAAMGYHRAGFDVVGVDIAPQKHYPFEFHQADALEYLSLHGHEFDVIHASPPCQEHMRNGNRKKNGTGWLLSATREILKTMPQPWIIENVPGAPMLIDYQLCGCRFSIETAIGKLVRERWFEVSWPVDRYEKCKHKGNPKPAISVTGHGTTKYAREKIGRCPTIAEYRKLMGIDWMTCDELSQAIPPAYTEYIGRQLWTIVNQSR